MCPYVPEVPPNLKFKQNMTLVKVVRLSKNIIEKRLWKLKIHQFEVCTWLYVISQNTQFPWRPLLLLLMLLCKNHNSYIFTSSFFFAYRRHVEVFWVLIFPLNFLFYYLFILTTQALLVNWRLASVSHTFVLLNLECNE